LNTKPLTYAIIGVLPESLLNFRGDLIKTLIARGGVVYGLSEPADDSVVKSLEALGARHWAYTVERRGQNPFKDVVTLLSLCQALRSIKPDVILSYTIKPVIYGGIASRLFPGARFSAMIEGLGYVFQDGGFGRRMIRWGVQKLYRFALRNSSAVFFLNEDNRRAFVDARIVQESQIVELPGIGVDLNKYSYAVLPPLPIRFLMIARLLREKGVKEYCIAAKEVTETHPEATFLLAGPEDQSADGVSANDVAQWGGGRVHYLGEVSNVAALLRDCHIFVLPSYHEGRPRTVQEALAVGRPVVTTDAPGCRDAIENGETGYIVCAKNSGNLAIRLRSLIESPDLWLDMPPKCRLYAQRKYDAVAISDLVANRI